MTNDEILSEFNKYAEVGLLDYVLPTDPLGEEWVVGITDAQGQSAIAKMNTDEARGFCIGLSAFANVLAKRQAPR